MKTVDQLFGAVMTLQLVATIVFLADNINNLDNVSYSLDLGTTTYNFILNLYAFFGIIAIIFVITLLASITIFGSGLNEYGSRSVARYVSFIILFIVMSLGITYYAQSIPAVSALLIVVSGIVYLLYIISNTTKPGV